MSETIKQYFTGEGGGRDDINKDYGGVTEVAENEPRCESKNGKDYNASVIIDIPRNNNGAVTLFFDGASITLNDDGTYTRGYPAGC